MHFDAADTASHEQFVRDVSPIAYGDLDMAIVAFGVLGSQEEFDDDPQAAADAVHVNYTGAVSSTLALAAQMRRQGHGHIVVLSSVAGERGRASNFVYGSSKAGLDAFAQGLGDSLAGSGVKVTVVRPGFVHSKMTRGLKSAPMAVTPARSPRRRRPASRPASTRCGRRRALRYVFMVLRHLPRPIFSRLPLSAACRSVRCCVLRDARLTDQPRSGDVDRVTGYLPVTSAGLWPPPPSQRS